MTETVVGLDPVATGASVVVAASDGVNRPRIAGRFVLARPLRERHPSVAEYVERATDLAQRVVRPLTGGPGKPTLVVLMKPTMGQFRTDTSAVRRIQIAGEIERLLVEHGVPVAEIPPTTVTNWALGPGSSARARRGFTEVESEINRLYSADIEKHASFRVTTIGAAVAGLVAAGLPTGHTVSPFDINTLEGMSLPRGWKLPDLHAKAVARAEKEKESVR